MASEDQDTEKEHEATQQKLDEARKKGEVPRSVDLGTAAVYAGFLISFTVMGTYLVQSSGTMLMNMLGNADQISQHFFAGSATPYSASWLLLLGQGVGPVFLLPAVTVVLAFIAQRAFIFAPEKLKPKLSRISVLSNAKNKFGRGGLFEFAKSFTKLLIYGSLAWFFLLARTDQILGSVHLSPGGVAMTFTNMALNFLGFVFLIALSLGAVDFLWQRQEHLRKHRMSRKEVQDEQKNQEGDPHFKMQRRQKGQAIAMNQMLADVADADVIIVNPEHYAVALKWDRNAGKAPVCVAKGVDDIAFRIRERATEAGIPIQRDPPTARALYATVDIGDEILREHYKAVAAAIRFADEMREKARKIFSASREGTS
ncbi:MAG: EscU/YscU/HrcU family type III secretion system export apparatus switch protein [Halocynthiibacter sp.]